MFKKKYTTEFIDFFILENDGPVTIILDSRSKKPNTTADEE